MTQLDSIARQIKYGFSSKLVKAYYITHTKRLYQVVVDTLQHGSHLSEEYLALRKSLHAFRNVAFLCHQIDPKVLLLLKSSVIDAVGVDAPIFNGIVHIDAQLCVVVGLLDGHELSKVN